MSSKNMTYCMNGSILGVQGKEGEGELGVRPKGSRWGAQVHLPLHHNYDWLMVKREAHCFIPYCIDNFQEAVKFFGRGTQIYCGS